MSGGWPARAGRSNYGPPMVDERPTTNPTRELNAAALNHLWWQLGGLGLLAPKCCFLFEPNATVGNTRLLFARFAWDPQPYDNVAPAGFPAYFSVARGGVGTHTFSFTSTVNDSDGSPQLLEGKAAFAASNGITGTYVAQNERAEVSVLSTSPLSVRTLTRAALISGPALVDAPVFVVVF